MKLHLLISFFLLLTRTTKGFTLPITARQMRHCLQNRQALFSVSEDEQTQNELFVLDSGTTNDDTEVSVATNSDTPNNQEGEESVFLGEAVSLDRNPNIAKQFRRNVVVAVVSVLLAVSNYAWQYMHPVSPISILAELQSHSDSLVEIGRNGKPTLVDFWAPWCEQCKRSAPTLQLIEKEYKGRVNFCLVNGDLGANWPLVERFGVDAIPHLALVQADGTVETALIGPIPKSVLEADLDALVQNADASQNQKQPLPYTMLDAFSQHPELRRVRFEEAQ